MTKTQNSIMKAQIAEREAKRAEYYAKDAAALAGKVRVQIIAFTHRSKVASEKLDDLSKKAETESEAWIKYHVAQELASKKKYKAAELLAELKKSKISFKRKARTLQDEKNIECNISEKEIEAKELEREARKALSDAKRAKLEAEEASTAKALIAKHAADLAKFEAELKNIKIEFEYRQAEAEFRQAEAKARIAEAKAIMDGNTAKAQACKLDAKLHRAEAKAKNAEIKALKAATKQKRILPKSQPPINQFPKGQARCVEKKHLSSRGLLDTVYEIFQMIPDSRGSQKSKSQITICDCLMSALALFNLKYPSLLQFDHDSQEGGCIEHNLKTLYKVNRVPCDTYMRECLDGIDPSYLRPAFKKLFSIFQRGKELEKYLFLDKYYLMSGDGTGFFSSKTTRCNNCCIKCHKDGSHTYYHQMMSAAIVHPNHATVIPFCPEPITNQDGSDKNDCERNAAERLYRHIRREHPHLPLIVTEDALGSNGPHIRLLKELDMRFILVVKPEGNKTLFEFLNGIQFQEYIYTDNEYTYKMRFINEVPLNDSCNDLMVNFIELSVYDKNNNLEYHNSWITDIFITTQNAYRLCLGGRAKWKIENETFNTLKNQSYHFEHNFGHGFKHLSTIFAFLMFLSFFIDQIEQSACGLFQAALMKMKSKIRLWGRMKAYFTTLFIDSWEQFWRGIAFGIKEGRLLPKISTQDTS